MQHFVVQDVFRKPFGHVFRVQRLTDRNGFMDSVMVSENSFGAPLRPGERRHRQLAFKISFVDSRIHFFEVVDAAV